MSRSLTTENNGLSERTARRASRALKLDWGNWPHSANCLPDFYALFGRQVKRLSGFHIERRIPRIDIPHRRRAIPRRRMRIGQHLLPQRRVSRLRTIILRKCDEKLLIARKSVLLRPG